ncbi:MAG: 4Fe-4S dicluster domain-containing protein [Kiritimatiellia bacterium]
MYKVSQNKLDELMQSLCRGKTVFAPEPEAREDNTPEQFHLVRSGKWKPDRHTLAPYRSVEPLKSLVFRPRELVGSSEKSRAEDMEERIVVGVKNCDLSALKIHDHVFLESDPVDPFYREAREKTILVSCDCTDALNVCFCPAVNQQPHAEEGFDINIAPVEDFFLLESGSERGAKLLEGARELLEDAEDILIAERDRRREEMTRKVCRQTEETGLMCDSDFRKAVSSSMESDLWEDFARDCVECGACSFVCCTCHCFLLVDGKDREKLPARVKNWDSCLTKNFARVAGGANPRSHRAERLYNRFDKKFVFFPAVLGTYACDGCGRCAEACTGKIDIRDVLKTAVEAGKQ